MGENEYGESDHLSIFTLLKHLMMLLKYNFFSGLHFFYTLPKTLIACRATQLRFFFKVKTLLNNPFNPFSTRPPQNALWYNNSWLYRFSKKFWIMYQKKEKNFLQKMSPHLSQLRWLIGILGKIICKLATCTKIADHYSRCKLATFFRLERIAKCSYIYFVYTKHQVLLICNENKEISVANLMIQ